MEQTTKKVEKQKETVNEKKVYTQEEAYSSSLNYFKGDELAARVWVSKYFPWNVGCMSGSIFSTAMAHSIIIPAAMKYISRQPSTSPTNPLMTREASMPVSRPDMTMPTLRPLFSGQENWEAIGTKICGIMEQIPVMSEAPHMM